MTHTLKIKLEYYQAIVSGRKTFEVRKDDRNFEVGDYINFVVMDGFYWEYTNETYRITYKLTAGEFPEGIQRGYCVLSIERYGEIKPL